MNTGVTFNLPMKLKNLLWKSLMTLIFEEVIISDRHMSDEQMSSFMQLFFNTEKIRLN